MIKFIADMFTGKLDPELYASGPPPKWPAKWRIDVCQFSSATDKYPYKVERYNSKSDYYESMMWFETYEEALEYVNKHYDMPIEFHEKPEVK